MENGNCILCSKALWAICYNFPAGLRQAARGARICETRNVHIWELMQSKTSITCLPCLPGCNVKTKMSSFLWNYDHQCYCNLVFLETSTPSGLFLYALVRTGAISIIVLCMYNSLYGNPRAFGVWPPGTQMHLKYIIGPCDTVGYHIAFYGANFRHQLIFLTSPAAKRQKRDWTHRTWSVLAPLILCFQHFSNRWWF